MMGGQQTKTIQLPEVLNQVSCADLQAEILEWLEQHPTNESLCLNIEKVERMGTTGMQLIIAASQKCKKSKIHIQIEGITPYFIEVAKDLGCYTQLQSQGLLP